MLENKKGCFEAMKNDYRELFEHPAIQYATNCSFDVVEDVEQDSSCIIDAEDGMIGTSGVGPCIAICATGKTLEGRVKLGIAHVSAVTAPEFALETIYEQMSKYCDQETIEFYLVGGQLPYSHTQEQHLPPQDPSEYSGTYETEMAFLKLKEKYPIKGVRLHCSNWNEAVDVVIGKNGICYSKKGF